MAERIPSDIPSETNVNANEVHNAAEQTAMTSAHKATKGKLYGFPKREHLCSQNEIEQLFLAGSTSLSAFPLRLVFRPATRDIHEPRVKVLISVAKRRLHHAVDRNRAKRQIREAYRLQKHVLTDRLPEGKAYNAAFIWLSDSPVNTARVKKQIGHLLQRMAERLSTTLTQPQN